jgi:hypothetical protein
MFHGGCTIPPLSTFVKARLRRYNRRFDSVTMQGKEAFRGREEERR